MPSRPVCLAIVLLWLSLNGWLFFHDLLPRLLPGQPPPYMIDLVEETRQRRPYIDWDMLREGKRAFRIRTFVLHPDHDVFELVAEFATPFGPPPPILGIRLKALTSTYRVNTAGDLLGMSVDVEGRLVLGGGEFRASLHGDTEAGSLTPHLKAEIPLVKYERALPTVSVPSGAAVLLPLHPVNRIQGIRPGQSWTVRVFDPLAAPLGALHGGAPEMRPLLARVRPKTESFTYNRRRDVECLVIDYDGDGFRGSTWVAKERGLVMSQEALLDNERWVMNRD